MFVIALLVAVSIADAFSPPRALTTKRYDGYKVLNIVPHNEEAIEILRQLEDNGLHIDFWKEPSFVGSEVHLMVSPEELPRVEAILSDAKIDFKTHIEDIQSELTPMWNEIDRRSLKSGKKVFDLNDFNSLEDVYEWLSTLENKCRSGLTCQLYSIGNSYEGRPIYLFKISSGAGRKGYWIDGTTHAREWLSLATTVNILNHLVTGGDANAERLTEQYDWYIVPIVNPDGYKYTWTTDRLWRKNRSPNTGSKCYGTDLNRNFDMSWGTDGVSKLPCNDVYCGSQAGSEPETQAVQNELVRLGKNLAGMVTLHAYGNYWMFPYGHTTGRKCARSADHNDLSLVAVATANAIQRTYNTSWKRGTSCETIYPASGGTEDFAKSVAGVKYAYCGEVRGNGFVVNKSNIPLSFHEIWNGIVVMCDTISA